MAKIVKLLTAFYTGHSNYITNMIFYQWFFKKSVFCLFSLRDTSYLLSKFLNTFAWRSSNVAHRVYWLFTAFLKHFREISHQQSPDVGGSNGWDNPVEIGIVPPLIIPICCVQAIEHYLVMSLNRNEINKTLLSRIRMKREIKKCEPRTKHLLL